MEQNNLKWWQRWIEGLYVRDGWMAVLAVIVSLFLMILGGLVVLEKVLGWDIPSLLGWLG